jgi:arylsulfatase
MQKVFNLMQDPFERADITSNTYWDWQLNEVGALYGVIDEVAQFAATFKEFPPRSFPPSFNPANMLEDEMDQIKRRESFKKSLDIDRIRGGLNKMIDERMLERGAQ